MQAVIKSVNNDSSAENNILINVDFDNGKEVVTKTYRYSNANLSSKQQVLDMIRDELKIVSGFKQVVEDLKTEIDVPIEAESNVEAERLNV